MVLSMRIFSVVNNAAWLCSESRQKKCRNVKLALT
jgi:hypothetical protein